MSATHTRTRLVRDALAGIVEIEDHGSGWRCEYALESDADDHVIEKIRDAVGSHCHIYPCRTSPAREYCDSVDVRIEWREGRE